MNLVCSAPAKLNLCLYLGETRDDGLHDLVSLFDSISLFDWLTLEPRGNGNGDEAIVDHVECPGIDDGNLVAAALASCRAGGLLGGGPVTVHVDKAIPIAAGLGGGSADAAATLRLVAAMYDRGLAEFDELAFELGADVPSQLRPGATLVQGAGEHLVPVDPRCLAAAARAYVVVAQREGLKTTDVFAEADRLGLPRTDLAEITEQIVDSLTEGLDLADLAGSIHNDFTPAIVSLRPELAGVPGALRAAGAVAAEFTGSGPTCFGVFPDLPSAEAAAAELAAAGHDARVAHPVDAESARPHREKEAHRKGRR